MGCSWSTVLNPCNMLRALWDFAVYCWRRFQVFCVRITTPDQAPTVARIVAFQSQSGSRPDHMERDFSLEARQGSVSSIQDSPLSDPSPSDDTFRIQRVLSRIAGASGGQQVAAVPEQMPRNEQDGGQIQQGSGQMQQDTPLLHCQGSRGSHDQPSLSGSASNKPDSSDKSYKTFGVNDLKLNQPFPC